MTDWKYGLFISPAVQIHSFLKPMRVSEYNAGITKTSYALYLVFAAGSFFY